MRGHDAPRLGDGQPDLHPGVAMEILAFFAQPSYAGCSALFGLG
jgi:hypothetical protein